MYSKESIQVFLKEQGKLFDEPVAETPEEAQEFLEECFAVELNSFAEVKQYFKELGTDVRTMSEEELKEQSEVFVLSKGRYLIVEG